MVKKQRRRTRVHIKSIKKEITSETGKLVKDLKQLAKCEPIDKAKTLYEYLLLIARVNNFIAESLIQIKKQIKEPTYMISSLFLRDCFDLLNQSEVESLHFVTGPEVGEIRVLDKIMDFPLEHQSVAFAKADSEAVRKVLIRLSQYKFRLWGYFHIHPGSGAGSTFPSGTDLTLDRLFDKGSYETVGAIFSRDGYVRFFSSRPFKIQIYGEGVKKINERLYRLVEIN